jgi:hypothetical protein
VEDHIVVEDGRSERPLLKLERHLVQLLQRHMLDFYAVVKTQSLQQNLGSWSQ